MPRSRSRFGPAAPLATACACAAGAAYVFANDPWAAGSVYPACPLYSATGLYCPGCGLTRASYRLLHGDVIGSLSQNLLLPVFAALAITAWWAWYRASIGRPVRRGLSSLPRGVWTAFAVTLVVYAVIRNFSFAEFLAPD